jgi:hypothetical protein
MTASCTDVRDPARFQRAVQRRSIDTAASTCW